MPIHTTRLQDYNYAATAMFFVTACASNRSCIFGNVEGGRVIYSEPGKIVEECWLSIPAHFPYVVLDEFVIMPNHIHGLVLLQPHLWERGDTACRVPTGTGGQRWGTTFEAFGAPVAGSLPTIMRSFKSAVTKRVHGSVDSTLKVWQQRFYEHAIRTDRDLEQTRLYVHNNPLQWELDRMHPGRK